MQSVIAQYEIDGWFRYEEWKGTGYELKSRARNLLKYGALEVRLNDMLGSTFYYLLRRRKQCHCQ